MWWRKTPGACMSIVWHPNRTTNLLQASYLDSFLTGRNLAPRIRNHSCDGQVIWSQRLKPTTRPWFNVWFLHFQHTLMTHNVSSIKHIKMNQMNYPSCFSNTLIVLVCFTSAGLSCTSFAFSCSCISLNVSDGRYKTLPWASNFCCSSSPSFVL